jgi:predicted ATPase
MSTEKKSKNLYITNVQLKNWRNFENITVDLQRRLFLIGPNASGKSNFLDALRFLADIVNIGGGFQHAVQKRGGISNIRCLAARNETNIILNIQIGTSEKPNLWRYELQFSKEMGRGAARAPMIAREEVWESGKLILQRPDKLDDGDPERLKETHLEQVTANSRFREIAEFLRSISYLHIVPQLIREPDRSIGKKDDPFGGDFLEQVASTPDKTQKRRLEKINNVLKLAIPQFKELEVKRDVTGRPHLTAKYQHWRSNGKWQTEDHLSDGTLRLMGLLWAILAGTSTLLLEEPELSLNSAIVCYLPQMFANVTRRDGRQIIVTTHANDLLADEGIGLDEVLILQTTEKQSATTATLAKDFDQVREYVNAGGSIADATIGYVSPSGISKISEVS